MINFDTGSKLADFQDRLFAGLSSKQNISASDYQQLKNNAWIGLAEIAAPNNLVLRQFILLDIYENSPHRLAKILNQIALLTYNSTPVALWAEGYSYWLYCKPFLKLYQDTFMINEIVDKIHAIDTGFVQTAYLRDTILYPVPIGDLRENSLEAELQQRKNEVCNVILITPVMKNANEYLVFAHKVGLNGHTSTSNFNVYVIKDQLYYDEKGTKPYKYYTGYNNEYPTFADKFMNIFKRLF